MNWFYVLLLYLRSDILTAVKAPETIETPETSRDLVDMRTCKKDVCYFSSFHSMHYETNPRSEKSKISVECSDDLTTFGELARHPIDPKTGETNALALLLCRGTGECDLDFSSPAVMKEWENVAICEHHADELLRQWDDRAFRSAHVYRSKGNTVCSMPDEIGEKHKQGRPATRNDILNITEADAIIKQLGYLVHPGIPICRAHKDYTNSLLTTAEKEETKTKRPRFQEGFYSNADDDTCPNDLSFISPSPKKKRTQAEHALQAFARIVDVEKVFYPNKKYDELTQRTQQNKVCAAGKLFDAMVGLIAGGDGSKLKKKVLSKLGEDESWTTGDNCEKNFFDLLYVLSLSERGGA